MDKSETPTVNIRGIFQTLGLDRWVAKRQVKSNAAVGAALYTGHDHSGGDHIKVEPTLPLGEMVRQYVADKVGDKKHNIRHRAANRFYNRLGKVKELVATLKYKTSGFENTENDRRALDIVARGVVDQAVKAGMEIKDCDMGWYKKAIVALYFVNDEDDEFFSELALALRPEAK
jgi:hypothetical protein